MPLIAESVSYTYGAGTGYEVAALAGVSFEVAAGELVLVAGATGSGKSTLMRVAAGLMRPGDGRIEIDGGAPEAGRGGVGLIFQDAEAQLFADTVLEDVAFGPRNLGCSREEAEDRACDALGMVGLDVAGYAERSPFTLSGGEARRAAIAGVLAMRPRYVLADEPTAGLDAAGRAALRAVLDTVRREAGLVIVSHALDEFLPLADRVLLLQDGRGCWYGKATDLVADPGPIAAAGLSAPDVLEVQVLARDLGLEFGEFTLDPRVAATSLVQAGGGR